MAERRMFSKTVTNAARFLMMPASARLFYYDLGMAADDDGIVEAFVVMRISGADMSDLELLEKKGYVKVLNDELVTQILDWKRNNLIKSDRYQPSVYRDLIPENEIKTEQNPCGTQVEPTWNPHGTQVEPTWNPSGTHLEPTWNPSGTHLEPQDRIGKDSIDKDRLGEGRANGPHPLTASEKEILVSEGISASYIDEREQRANDYALSRKRAAVSVLREWWASDKSTYVEPPTASFDTDEFFEAALARSMRMIQESHLEAG